jgi:ABC-type Fe3+-hydroxamate transport system substrate-binding protein
MRIRRSPLLAVLALAVLATAVSYLLSRRAGRPSEAGAAGEGLRVISLSPAMTEVLFAIGAGSHVVGVSDYCLSPPEARDLPRAGTVLTPNYEAIARLSPTLIVGDKTLQAPEEQLAAIAPTRLLPWLTLQEITEGIRTLGFLTDRAAASDRLAERMNSVLGVEAPPDGPEVLLALEHRPGQLSEVWYIKDNSIHGAALRAAGGRNVVAQPVKGAPRMSLEKVLELDPQIIVILSNRDLGEDEKSLLIADWKKLSTLQAVRHNAIRVIAGADILTTGPGVLDLVGRLRAAIRDASRGNP